MSAVRLLARSISVICTIHQPSAEIVGMFDWLLLMRPGGFVVYFAKMKNLPDWFRQHGLGDCPPEKNIADFALEQVKKFDSSYVQKMETGKKEEAKDGKAAPPSNQPEVHFGAESGIELEEQKSKEAVVLKDIALEFANSTEGQATITKVQAGIVPRTFAIDPEGPVSQMVSGGPRVSFLVQFKELTERFFLATVRNRQVLGVRVFLTLFMGFVVGTVFFQLSFSQSDADQRVSAVFVTLLFVMFTANAALPDIFFARPMYFRETGADMYSAASFYLARYFADIPFIIGECLLLALMIQFIATLATANNVGPFFGWFFLALLAVRWASMAATYAIGYLIESANNANTIHATYFNLLFAMSGFLIPGSDIGVWWIWFYYLNFLQWGLSFISANMERYQLYTCDISSPASGQMIPVFPADVKCPLITGVNSLPGPTGSNYIYQCTYACGLDLLDDYGIKSTNPWLAGSLALVVALAFVFAVIGYFCVKHINHIKR